MNRTGPRNSPPRWSKSARKWIGGNATVAELQIFYLQKDAASWVKNTTEYLDEADQENKKVLEERRKSDETAATATIVIAFLSTLLALGIGRGHRVSHRQSPSPSHSEQPDDGGAADRQRRRSGSRDRYQAQRRNR